MAKIPSYRGCYTAGVLMGKKGDRFYILDVIREQVAPEQLIDLMKATIVKDTAR